MFRFMRRELLLSVMLTTACRSNANAPPPSGSPAPSPSERRGDVLTRAELDKSGFNNLYDAVKSLRNRWLQPRGPDSILGKSGEVQVRLDDQPMGGVDALRSIAITDVVSVRFVDPVDAAARWGLGYGHGAIVVSSR